MEHPHPPRIRRPSISKRDLNSRSSNSRNTSNFEEAWSDPFRTSTQFLDLNSPYSSSASSVEEAWFNSTPVGPITPCPKFGRTKLAPSHRYSSDKRVLISASFRYHDFYDFISPNFGLYHARVVYGSNNISDNTSSHTVDDFRKVIILPRGEKRKRPAAADGPQPRKRLRISE